jgi:hypothetical protein
MNTHVVLSLAHLAFVVPLFLYVAFQRAASPDWIYWLLFSLGLIVFAIHAVKAVYRYTVGSTYLWVNLLHAILIAPLLVYIGYNGKKTPRSAYELLAMAGFAALGYHAYSLLLQVQIIQAD